MNNRPKNTDSEKELEEMQAAYYKEKESNENFQPAAKVVRIKRTEEAEASTSEIKTESPKKFVLTDIVLGEIVERVSEISVQDEERPKKIKPVVEKKPIVKGTSIFAQMMNKMKIDSGSNSNEEDESVESHKMMPTEIFIPKKETMKRTYAPPSMKSLDDFEIPRRRVLYDNSLVSKIRNVVSTAPETDITKRLEKLKVSDPTPTDVTKSKIHEENLEKLHKMSEEEILKEKENLLVSLDPKLIKFLKSREPKKVEPKIPASPMKIADLPELELLKSEGSENWLNFNIIEPEKLEWMKDVRVKLEELEPGTEFEARFDWKGILLPFREKMIGTENPELFLHGEDPDRAGYTIQEFFRLARSNVLQQRTAAFSAINGILSIYNQGFYDNVLELPIAKIFFLLRFGLDDNTQSILELTTKGLASLFYNEADEALLDAIFDSATGTKQPIPEMYCKWSKTDEDNFAVNQSAIEVDVQPEDVSENDFIVAEKDLIECLLRTNILNRIYYILEVVRPDNSTVISCIKILIQIARSGQDNAMRIVVQPRLIDCLLENFLTDLELATEETIFYNHPQPLVIKLLRILAVYNLSLRTLLETKNFFMFIKGYVYSRKDLNIKTIQLQIESFRYIRNFQQLSPNCGYYNEILPALRFLLEWHYHYSEYTECSPKGHPLIRQHASALLSLLNYGNTINFWSIFHDLLPLCLNKWFNSASKDGIDSGFSHYMLLSCCLDIATTILENKSRDIQAFYETYLIQFLISPCFLNLCSNMTKQSTLLSQYFDRSSKLKSLNNFGSVVFADNKSGPSLIITEKYPFFLMTSLTKFIYHLKKDGKGDRIAFLGLELNLNQYLQEISLSVNEKIKMNWFCTYEVRFLYTFLIYQAVYQKLSSSLVVRLAYKLTTCFGKNCSKELNFLIDKILFENKYFDANSKMNAFKRAYLVYFDIKPTENEFTNTVDSWSTPFLPVNWPYELNSVFYHRMQSKEKLTAKLEDFDIIQTSLYYTRELEKYLQLLSPTNKLSFLMMPFFSTAFLEADVKEILTICIKKFFDAHRDEHFDFENTTVIGNTEFSTFYNDFIAEYKSTSYGDKTFTALLLVPAGQRYDIKWRNLIWFEHIEVMRYLDCEQDMLCGGIDAYTVPMESDKNLLAQYKRVATNWMYINGETLPLQLARFHAGIVAVKK